MNEITAATLDKKTLNSGDTVTVTVAYTATAVREVCVETSPGLEVTPKAFKVATGSEPGDAKLTITRVTGHPPGLYALAFTMSATDVSVVVRVN